MAVPTRSLLEAVERCQSQGQCGRVRCQYRQLELADFDEPLDDQQDNNCDETIDEKYSNKGCWWPVAETTLVDTRDAR
jgi:hypothetical protein